MIKILVQGTVFGALTLFAWNLVSWMVLPWHNATLMGFTDEDDIGEVIKASTPKSGVYILPNPHTETAQTEEEKQAAYREAEERKQRGPFAFMVIHPKGSAAGMTQPLIYSFLVHLLTALFMTWLVMHQKNRSFMGRLGVIVLLSGFASLLCHFPYWNWWGFPTTYSLVTAADLVIGWTLAGLAIAKVTA